MKKIHNDEVIRLSPVKMYWDDLQEIYDRIKKDRSIEVESEEYKYKDLDDLQKNTKKNYINKIKLNGRSENFKNTLSLEISPGKVTIYQDADSTETASKIKDILNKNSPWHMYSPDSPFWHIMTSFLGWIGIYISGFILLKSDYIYLKLIMPIIGIGLMLWTFKDIPVFGRTKIFTFLKKDNISFWDRNKDQFTRELIIGLILAIIGFIIGYIFAK